MKIDHTKINEMDRAFLTNRGAPEHLFSVKINLTDYLHKTGYMTDGGRRVDVTVPQQLQFFKDLTTKKIAKPITIVIASKINDRIGQAVALSMFHQAMKLYNNNIVNMQGLNQPYWHSVMGWNMDKLRDQAATKLSAGHMTMLVIDNLAKNSTYDKVEKVRDLLYVYANTPRIVIASGADPFEIAQGMLNIMPTCVINIGHKKVQA